MVTIGRSRYGIRVVELVFHEVGHLLSGVELEDSVSFDLDVNCFTVHDGTVDQGHSMSSSGTLRRSSGTSVSWLGFAGRRATVA